MVLRESTRSRSKRISKLSRRSSHVAESVELRTLKVHWREYEGKNVIVIGKEIYPIQDGDQAARLLEELRKKYPKKTPLLTFVWGEETYILCL